MRRTPTDRYLAKVDRRGDDECWPWTGARNQWGYGLFRDEHGRSRSATRWAYGYFIGPVAPGEDLCHSCDTPSCHNPAHWWLGTRQQNVADMYTKGRDNRRGIMVGELHPRSKLTDAQRREIQQRAGQRTLKQFAVEYGVSATAIRHVIISSRRY